MKTSDAEQKAYHQVVTIPDALFKYRYKTMMSLLTKACL